MIGGTGRIGVDAVGLALLKELGSNKKVMSTKIFEQEQTAGEVELGIGVASPADIEIVTDDVSWKYGDKLTGILAKEVG